jgi:hypothetical protein
MNPDWIPLERPQAPFGKILAEACRRLEANLFTPEASQDARQVAQNAYLFGLKTTYEMLRKMRAGETTKFPFELAFDQLGRELATMSRKSFDS